jgi:hypothetical protein
MCRRGASRLAECNDAVRVQGADDHERAVGDRLDGFSAGGIQPPYGTHVSARRRPQRWLTVHRGDNDTCAVPMRRTLAVDNNANLAGALPSQYSTMSLLRYVVSALLVPRCAAE